MNSTSCAGGLAVLAVLGAVQVAGPFLLIAAGEGAISSSLAGILVATAPIFTALFALRIDPDERSEGSRLAGVVIGIVGVVVLFGLDLTGSSSTVLGGLAVILAAAGYAVGGFIVKSRLRGAPPIGIVAVVMGFSALLLVPAALATLPSSVPGLGPVAAMVGLGLAGTGIAFIIFYSLIAAVGPAKAMLVSYIAPGFAVVYGAVFLSEDVTAGKVIGLALILAGSWLGAGGSRAAAEPETAQPSPELSAAAFARSEAATR